MKMEKPRNLKDYPMTKATETRTIHYVTYLASTGATAYYVRSVEGVGSPIEIIGSQAMQDALLVWQVLGELGTDTCITTVHKNREGWTGIVGHKLVLDALERYGLEYPPADMSHMTTELWYVTKYPITMPESWYLQNMRVADTSDLTDIEQDIFDHAALVFDKSGWVYRNVKAKNPATQQGRYATEILTRWLKEYRLEWPENVEDTLERLFGENDATQVVAAAASIVGNVMAAGKGGELTTRGLPMILNSGSEYVLANTPENKKMMESMAAMTAERTAEYNALPEHLKAKHRNQPPISISVSYIEHDDDPDAPRSIATRAVMVDEAKQGEVLDVMIGDVSLVNPVIDPDLVPDLDQEPRLENYADWPYKAIRAVAGWSASTYSADVCKVIREIMVYGKAYAHRGPKGQPLNLASGDGMGNVVLSSGKAVDFLMGRGWITAETPESDTCILTFSPGTFFALLRDAELSKIGYRKMYEDERDTLIRVEQDLLRTESTLDKARASLHNSKAERKDYAQAMESQGKKIAKLKAKKRDLKDQLIIADEISAAATEAYQEEKDKALDLFDAGVETRRKLKDKHDALLSAEQHVKGLEAQLDDAMARATQYEVKAANLESDLAAMYDDQLERSHKAKGVDHALALIIKTIKD